MQIPTFQKEFKAFECKFEPFERDSKHSNANSSRPKGIRSIQMQILTIQKDSKGIQSIQMQIRTIQKGFKAFECKF